MPDSIRSPSADTRADIALIFRRPMPGGYFSIERYFGSLWEHLAASDTVQIRKVVAARVSKGLWKRVFILLQMARLQADIYHITGDIHFAALATPKRRTIVTIHDCGFVRHPNPIARKLLLFLWLKWPVRRCKFVTTVSEASKQDILRLTACPPEKIRVIPAVISVQFQARPQPFHPDKPRILHIGSAPNKNLLRHIEALKDIPCTLHIIARLDRKEQCLLEQYQIDFEHDYNLSEVDIRHAYEACDLLLFASTFEGFGLPILEAQAVGRPVVTGNCSSMPEVAGEGACLVDPFDVRSIRAGVWRVIREKPFRDFLIQKGFENCKRFDIKIIAQMYLNVYQETNHVD